MSERRGRAPDFDPEAFEAVYRAHYAQLCDFVNGYVRSSEAARDLVQDLFLNLWERCEAGDAPPLTSAYLYAAARNRALKHLRHTRVVARWEASATQVPQPRAGGADEQLRSHEVAQAIERAIDQLPERCREIFLMSRQHDLSYAAIAETLGISVKTVETQMWRALKALRAGLAPYITTSLVIAASPLAQLATQLLR